MYKRQTWDEILTGLEDGRACVALTSIDFEKAFNRMEHGACLRALREHGASNMSMKFVRSFLEKRRMTVRIGDEYSSFRQVAGGSPQGSILGNYLFCMTTDRLEVGISAVSAPAPPSQEIDEGLARIRHEHPSELGSNDITLEREFEELCVPFDRNGTQMGSDQPEEEAQPPELHRDVVALLDDEDRDGGTEDEEPFSFFRANRPFRIYDTPETVVRRASSFRRELGVGQKWHDRDLLLVKYIDDFNCCEKINTFSAPFALSQQRKVITVTAERTKSLYKEVRDRAKSIGMKINNNKTQVLCISCLLYTSPSPRD